jgi:hypothetical protein
MSKGALIEIVSIRVPFFNDKHKLSDNLIIKYTIIKLSDNLKQKSTLQISEKGL